MTIRAVCIILCCILLINVVFIGGYRNASADTEFVESAAAGSVQAGMETCDTPVIELYADQIRGEKDPFVAGLLSWFMMGIGQIYAQEYTKGSLFIAAGVLNKTALVFLISHINNKYAPSGDEIINANWQSFDNRTRTLIITYLAAYFSLRFYNVADAVRSAEKYNDRYRKQREGLSLTANPGGFSLQYDYRFSD